MAGRRVIEGSNPASHGRQQRFKLFKQKRAPSSLRHGLQPNTDFQDRDGGDPDRSSRLAVEPCQDFGIGSLPHQGGKDVGIQKDHGSKSAAPTAWPRNSGISVVNPALENRAAISVPNPPEGLSSRAASRRISRTSSSMLWPCRSALRRSLALTLFSRSRTTS